MDELTGNKCLQKELNLANVVCSRIGEVSKLPVLPMHRVTLLIFFYDSDEKTKRGKAGSCFA